MARKTGYNINGERILPGDENRAEENHEISILFDIYGKLLSEKNYEIMSMYYNEDFSLAEIAEHTNMTRQGTHNCIKSCRTKLREYEEKLGLIVRAQNTRRDYQYIMKRLDELAKQGNQVLDIKGRLKMLQE